MPSKNDRKRHNPKTKTPDEMSHKEYRKWRNEPIKNLARKLTEEKNSREYKTRENLPDPKSETPSSTVEVFDALPHNIQNNHALIEAFCYWYLRKTRRLDQETKRQVQKKAKQLMKKYPDMKSGDMAKLPEILEVGAKHFQNITVRRWLRPVLKKGPGRPKKN
jgi:hypothetical protein